MLLMIDSSLVQARSHLAKRMLEAAFGQQNWPDAD